MDGGLRSPGRNRTRGGLPFFLSLCLLHLLPACASVPPSGASVPDAPRECVVMLHGLGRTKASMWLMGRYLEKQGYEVRSIGYPSRLLDADELVTLLRPRWEAVLAEHWDRVHVVGHSLGGVLAWTICSGDRPAELGRMVLLAPPGSGSEVADRLGASRFYRWVLGPVMEDLGTGGDDLPARLPPVNWETGVIAGNRSLNPWFSSMIPGPDDGKIGVERAAVPGQSDFLVVASSHTWMMNRDVVQQQVHHFLRHGAFSRPSTP